MFIDSATPSHTTVHHVTARGRLAGEPGGSGRCHVTPTAHPAETSKVVPRHSVELCSMEPYGRSMQLNLNDSTDMSLADKKRKPQWVVVQSTKVAVNCW